MTRINTVVVGACGKMGRTVIKGILESDDLELVGAVDVVDVGQDVSQICGLSKVDVPVSDDLAQVLDQKKVQVVIDFTYKEAAAKNIVTALKKKVAVVTGTTGFSQEEMQAFSELARENGVGMFFAANFSLGAVLMMKYAREIAKYFPQAEIIEYHNDRKKDSPSGTAIATAQGMREAAGLPARPVNNGAPSRGGEFYGYQVHSVRMSSFVAHQEVIFGGNGEILTLRHDSFNRECFIPGVLLAARKVGEWQGLQVGLESILEHFVLQ